MNRQCLVCFKVKPFDEFGAGRNGNMMTACRECVKKVRAAFKAKQKKEAKPC
jgi:ribosomal protein S20